MKTPRKGFASITGWQLKHFVTLVVSCVFLLILSFSLLRSVSLQIESERSALTDLIQRDLGILVRHTERTLKHDPAQIREDLSQLASDPRVDSAAVIDENNIVLFGKDLTWGQQKADALFSPDIVSLINHAKTTRLLLTGKDASDHNLLAFAMSYVSPQPEHHLRATQRGVVLFICNFDRVKQKALRQALTIAAIDATLLLLAVALLLGLLHRYVSDPLQQILVYSRKGYRGPGASLRLDNVPSDLLKLADAIRQMKTDLSDQLLRLQEESELGNLILNNIDDVFLIVSETGNIVSASPLITSIFGYQPDELTGQNISVLMPSPHRENHDTYMRNYQQTRVKAIIGRRREMTGLHKEGREFPIELLVQEIDRKGEHFYVGAIRDISERNRLEKAKNEFVSIVSHELRTPLTAINGALGIIMGTAREQIPGKVLNLIEIAQRNGLRLLKLINDLLDMEKLMAGKMPMNFSVQSVVPLVRYAVELLEHYCRDREVRISYEPGNDALIHVDADRLNQSIANLLSNAIKFSPPQATVRVCTWANGGWVRISVIDQGPGIPAEFRERIFQKFAQADCTDTRQKGGTGLGLAITREMVERMGGRIGFNADSDAGTEFFIEFPQAEEH